VVVVRETPQGLRFLLLRAFRHWDFPKGAVEAGETPLEAARREVAEEAGITELEFVWGEDYQDTPPYDRGKVARYYLARTASERVELKANPTTGVREHDEYRWLRFEDAWDLASPRVRGILSWCAAKLNIRTEHPQMAFDFRRKA
jgi:bis(5'-nucleosidyl)-tetraphosphatase